MTQETQETEIKQLRDKVKHLREVLEIFADPDAWYNCSGERHQIPVKATLIAQAALRTNFN